MGDENEKIVRIRGETLVIKFSPDEANYRDKYLPDPTKLTDEKLVCTVCSTPLATDVHKGNNIFVHRVLNVLVCELCYNFYGDGNFSVDEDGDDKYCRWCGQGGTLYLCSTCSCAFCQKCVKQNLKASVIADLDKDDWKCYICNPRPLFGTRTICWGAEKLNEIGKEKERERLRKLEEKKKEENGRMSRKDLNNEESSKRKRRRSIESDSTSPEVMPSKKPRRKASQNGFGKEKRRRKSSSEESSEGEKVVKHSRSRTSKVKKNVSYAESSSDDESDSRRKSEKKIKKKKRRDTSGESSDDKNRRTNRKSTRKGGDSSNDSSNEERTKIKKSGIKKKPKDDSDSSSDEKKRKKKYMKTKKYSSSDDSSEDKKRKSFKKHNKSKNDSSEEDAESLKKDKKFKKRERQSKNTLESDDDTKKSKNIDDESMIELSSKNVTTNSQAEDKIVKKRIKLAVVWLSNAAKDIAELGSLISVRATKFKQKKVNTDCLKTYEDVIKTVNKVKQLITGIHSNYDHIEKNLEAQLKPWKILTGIEDTETKILEDDNKETEDTNSRTNSQSILEPGIKELSNDSCVNTGNETSCAGQANHKSKNLDNENIELQWSGDDSDNEKQNATKDLISKANETLDKMEEEEEESPKVDKSLTEKKSVETPSKADKILDKIEEADALSKENQSVMDSIESPRKVSQENQSVMDSIESPKKVSLSEDDEIKNTDEEINKKEPNDSAHSSSTKGKYPSTHSLDKNKEKVVLGVSSDLGKGKQKDSPGKDKNEDRKSVTTSNEKKVTPDKSSSKSKSAIETESDSDKDLFTKKNSGEKVFEKKSQDRRKNNKKVTRKSLKENSECTEKSVDSQDDVDTGRSSSESSLKTFGEKLKDKWNSSQPLEDMKLIAPIGSDLSEEELETNNKSESQSKRKEKDSSEDSDTHKAGITLKRKAKSLAAKKQKTSATPVNKHKTKKVIKCEKLEEGVANKEQGENSKTNKNNNKKSSNTILSNESEDESEGISKEGRTNHKANDKSIKSAKEKSVDSKDDVDTARSSSESSLKTFGEKLKDKWNSSQPLEDMKLIAPIGSDLSEEELETNNKSESQSKRKEKDLAAKKQKTSVTPVNNHKTKKVIKCEKLEEGVANKEQGENSKTNKNNNKKSSNTILSNESEDESEGISKEERTNHKANNKSIKSAKGKCSTNISDSDESFHETINNHDNKKKTKLRSREKTKVHSNRSLSSGSGSDEEPEKDCRKNTKSTKHAVEEKKDTKLATNGKKRESTDMFDSSVEEKTDVIKESANASHKTRESCGDFSVEKTKIESKRDNLIESEDENDSAPKKFVSLGSSSENEDTKVNDVNTGAKKKTVSKKEATKETSSKRPAKNLLLLDSSDEENEPDADNPDNLRLLSSDEENEGDEKKKVKTSVTSGSIENLSSAESSDEEIFRKKKRKTTKSSDSDFEESKEEKKRSKRKLVRCASTSDESDDENGGKSQKSPGKSPGKGGRKNIKKIKKDLAESTKEAAEEEKERRKRIEDRQKLFNQVFEVKESKIIEQLVLDFDPENKKELLSVNKDLVAKMKPHQAKGVKFMWDSCFESINDCKKKKGSGCILAHCMGLGKTFQVISLVHTLLMNEDTQVRTVMVVCPLSTVLNWFNEFDKWLDNIEGGSSIDVYHLTRLKNNPERARELRHWQNTGGVLIMGYEMFRNLTAETTKKFRAKMKKDFQETLVDPGADLIVCDEGHMLKNEQTALSKAMGRVRTLRRIVLTGTPMQNNLVEYHCMVQFVKPNLLGTKKEFLNRFVNPITNGQFVDSTERDVSIMKRRAHVLHKMLEGLVQRFDYNVLTPFLPPKHEYVVSICLSELQVKMYQHYLDHYSQRSNKEKAGSRLFQDWQALGRIWTHPRVVKMSSEKAAIKKAMMEESDDEEGSLKDFIDDSDEKTTSDSGSESSDSAKSIQSHTKKKRVVQTRRKTRSNATNDAHLESEEEENLEKESEENPEKVDAGAWWSEFLKPEDLDDIRHSGKLMLLFGILKESEMIEDKVLVFSQSLFSLDLIEYFLDKIDAATQEDRLDESLGNHQGTWSKGLDYFRLDGSTSSDNRNIWCKAFNRDDNPRARLFLISTRAGGLGINLTAANRVIIFDASWNPSHDVQSIFRVYRFGQKKPCYVYRFIAHGTMEEKVYDRQVAKQSISNRVVDEQQVHRHFTSSDLNELYTFTPPSKPEDRPIPSLPKDVLMAELLAQFKEWIEKYHEHDSLLENVAEEELNEEERKLAWEDYETEKKRGLMPNYANNAAGTANNFMNMQIEMMRQNLKTKFPDMSDPELTELLTQQVSMLMRQQHMLQQQQRMAQQQFQQQQMAAKVMKMREQQQQAQWQMKQMYQKVPPGVFMNQQGAATLAGGQPNLLSSFLNMPSGSNAQMRMSTPHPQMTPTFKEMEKMRQKYLAAKNPGVTITEIKDDPKPSSS